MRKPESHKVSQKQVINWHAKLNQMYYDLARINTLAETLSTQDIRQMVDEIRADIDNLREKLPPVQLELPNIGATS